MCFYIIFNLFWLIKKTESKIPIVSVLRLWVCPATGGLLVQIPPKHILSLCPGQDTSLGLPMCECVEAHWYSALCRLIQMEPLSLRWFCHSLVRLWSACGCVPTMQYIHWPEGALFNAQTDTDWSFKVFLYIQTTQTAAVWKILHVCLYSSAPPDLVKSFSSV